MVELSAIPALLRFRPLLLSAALAGCGDENYEVVPSLPAGTLPPCSAPLSLHGRFTLDTIASGLEVPWGIAFLPDGRILITERPGRIRVIENGALRQEPWAALDVAHQLGGEAGLMGIAADRNFAESRAVYAVATFSKSSNLASRALRRILQLGRPTLDAGYVNRVLRFTDRDGFGSSPAVVVDDLPSFVWKHAGGALGFGPDGMLYTTLGDAGQPPSARSREGPNGSVLRYRADGSVPADNPSPGSPVFAHGLRNVQGLAWHPETAQLWVTDHGPTGAANEGGRFGHDELNRIVPGGDYGWPVAAGAAGDSRFRDPMVVWHPAVAPAGAAWLSHEGGSSLFVTGLVSRTLRRIVFAGNAADPVCEDVILDGDWGRLRAVARAPDGSLYVGTSNRDGRGAPGPANDLLMRLSVGSGR